MAASAYHLSPLAEADLEGIWLYTFQTWSSEQADKYHRAMVSTFEALASGRKQGRAVDVRPGYLKERSGSHMIYFRRVESKIEIMRVLHGRMDVDRNL
jgi:toxin ParE1/3/4